MKQQVVRSIIITRALPHRVSSINVFPALVQFNAQDPFRFRTLKRSCPGLSITVRKVRIYRVAVAQHSDSNS